MFKGHSRAVRPRPAASTVTKVPLKGLFSDHIWKCNCNPRLPAQRFQTKNGGKNHGRWFYVCQHPQTKRCDFFIWEDEAKGREAAAVLNNTRTEPCPEPTTPGNHASYGLPTPQTDRFVIHPEGDDAETPYTPSKPQRSGIAANGKPRGDKDDTQHRTATRWKLDDEKDEFLDWPSSNDEEINKAVDHASQSAPLPPETPRKSMKTDGLASPGKRRFGDISAPTLSPPATGRKPGGDIFTTPATSTTSKLIDFNTPSAPETPSEVRYAYLSPPAPSSELANEILLSLQTALSVPLFAEARENIERICHRHAMYTKGVTKGRDVWRDVVKKKEERIIELQNELEGVKNEREIDRSVIRQLRGELAAQNERRQK